MTSPVCPAAVVPPSERSRKDSRAASPGRYLDEWRNYSRERDEWVDKSDIQEAIVVAC